MSEQFNEVYEDLETLMKGVAGKYSRKYSNTKGKSAFAVAIDAYRNVYNKVGIEVHMGYFRTLYEENKGAILTNNFEWLVNKLVQIKFGQDKKISSNKAVLHLSTIYKMAKKLNEDANKEIANGGLNVDNDDLIYVEYMKCYLTEIFKTVTTNPTEITILEKQADKYQEELSDEKPEYENNNTGQPDIFGGISSMFKNMTQPNENGENQISSFFNNMMKNPEVSNLVGKISSGRDLSEIIPDLSQKINNPALTELIGKVLPKPKINTEGDPTIDASEQQ